MFEYVSCANYFGEIVEWSGFAVACWSLAACAFAFLTACNLVPRALSHHRSLNTALCKVYVSALSHVDSLHCRVFSIFDYNEVKCTEVPAGKINFRTKFFSKFQDNFRTFCRFHKVQNTENPYILLA